MLSVCCLCPDAKIPARSSARSAGLDFYSLSDFQIKPRDSVIVSTGIAIALPHNTYGQLVTPSGMALKMCCDVVAGVIDEDYRGEIKVIIRNASDVVVSFPVHYKIAQMIVIPCLFPPVSVVTTLDVTERGSAGFGQL